jgi:predicted secreted protein
MSWVNNRQEQDASMTLTLNDILDAAREKTGGLANPDDDSWREGLEILLKDHARENRLTERGWDSVRNRYTNCLASRMMVDEYHRQHPQLASTVIVRPVFILGMPRTGTTMVSYLFESDPAVRSMLRWEAYNVAPPAEPGALRSDSRCLAEVAKDDMILKAAAKVAAAHFEPGDSPTECVHLLAQDFRSLMLAVVTTTPTYHDWLMQTNMESAFTHRRRVLQILQSTNPGRWVLKMPSDSLFVRQIFKTFPDARVIWTHRDPYAASASAFGMRGASRPFSEIDAGAEYMRQYFPLQFALHLSRPLEVSLERPDDFYHLYYDQLLADPLAEMHRVYDWLGDEWTVETEAGMRGWLDNNPQNKHGKHSYSFAEWGISQEDMVPYFSDYLRVHPVARGKVA